MLLGWLGIRCLVSILVQFLRSIVADSVQQASMSLLREEILLLLESRN